MEEYDIQVEMVEAMLDIPYTFSVGRKVFRIYPETLGMVIRLKPMIAALGIRRGEDMTREAVRAVMTNPMAAAKVIAVHTLEKPSEIKSMERIEKRARELMKDVDPEDIVKLLVVCLNRGKQLERFMEAAEMTGDQERRRRVMEAKSKKNTYFFGGRTEYGQLIDVVCERYGWTFDYVLWGISFTNLQMLVADQSMSVYLTDEEMKSCRIPSADSEVLRADDPRNRDLIMQMFKN